jgi:hypothetical protein
MTTNSQQVRRAGNNTRVYLAPVGTTAPADDSATLDTDWVEVGLTTDDSLGFSTNPEFFDVTAQQSDFPVRTFQTGDEATLKADLLQWNAANFKAVYGGGTITEVGSGGGHFKFVPPTFGGRDEIAAIIEIVDTYHYRFVFPRTQQKEGVDTSFAKGDASKLSLSLTVLGGDSTDPWYLLTNDPAFDPGA